MKSRYAKFNLFGGSLHTSFTMPPAIRKAALTFGMVVLPIASSHATPGTWTATTGTPASWAVGTNWSSGLTTVGDTAGDVVAIQSNITAAYTINLNSARTLGSLTIGDSDSTHIFTLANGTGGSLAIDQTGTATAYLRFSALTAADVVSANIALNDNLQVYSVATSIKTLSGAISGASKSITFDNDDGITGVAPSSATGIFTLSAANSYTGGTIIDDVRVQISNASAFGAATGGTVDVKDGGGVWINTTTAVATGFKLEGAGWLEGSGKLGTIRMCSGSSASNYTISGNIQIVGTAGDSMGTTPDAGIFPLTNSTTAANGLINGVISGGDLLIGSMSTGTGATTWTGNETLYITNTNTYCDTVIRPLDIPTSGQMTLLVGDTVSNTTATLGTGKVYLHGGVGGKAAALRIQRSDGYTMQQDVVTSSASGTNAVIPFTP